MAIYCDFEKDLREILIKDYRRISCPVDSSASTEDLYLRKLSIFRRELPVIKWKVYTSDVLKIKSLPSEIRLGLQAIIFKAEEGENLNNHLSKLVAKQKPKGYNDKMLNDWGG